MKQLGKVLNKTSWAQASNTINTNSESVFSAVTMLENAAFKHKGYFLTSEEVEQLYPSAEEGSQAFVYNSSNPSTAPYDIYQMIGGTWVDTGLNGGSVSVDLTKKQDTLVGYSESVSGGKATQVAIQGDTIALSGKVSLGNVDDIESAILMSSSQAGAAIAKANTLEQSMNAIKSPVKPIHLNSQGKLELNIGKGLYVENGKLCTTGASGGGGGGATLSEGAGISILNNKISVAYNTKTLGIDSCGGLTVNYGEGLTIKNGKLSAQASVNAGNGLVKKGDALQVSVGTGLLVADDVYVNMGKGLATDNENKVNVNLDEQTLTTDSSGKVIVNKDSLIGNGLKQESSKLAVNYGTGLALRNKAIVVDYGTGLDIQGGKLVSTVQGGKTYVAGDAIGFDGNNINVKYDGVTISTKDSTDKSLHVMLGSGLKQGTSGIDVAVGAGLAIGSDNKLYSTVSSGATYSAGDGISISGGKISFNLGTSLESKCGYIQVAISSGLEYDENNEARIRVKAGNGITIPNTGEVRAHLSNGLAFDNYGAIKICDAVLTDISNLKDSKQDKLTLATGLEWGKTDMIQVKMNAPLNYDEGGRLKLNHDSTLTVSDGKLGVSMYGIMDNEGGLTLKNNGLAVNVGRGLKIESCQVVVDEAVMTEVGKIGGKQDRLSVSDGLKLANSVLKLRLSTSCSNINTSGLGYDDNGGLMVTVSTGLGIDRKIDGRLYIRCGPGITCNTGNDLTISYGSGLDVLDGKVVLHENIYDRLDNAEGGIGRCVGAITDLHTAVGGKQEKLTLATGLEWGKTDMIQVKMNAPLNYDEGGRLKLNHDSTLTVSNNKLGVDLYGVMDGGGGLFIKNNGLAVNVGRGLKIDSCQVVVDYGTGLKVVNNKLDVDTSKIAGVGIDLDSAYKMLTIGTKAAKELAGTGLAADGPKMKVKYGSGLTTNSCGGLIVDAANLTVGNADKLGGNGIGNFMTFSAVGGSYVDAQFNDSTLSKVAAEKYIEFWDGAGGWFNSVWGKVTANSGFVGNLTGTADTANGAYNMNIGFATQQDACVPDGFNTMRIFRVSGSNATYTGGDDGWILAFKWAQGNYVTQIYIDVDPTHIMSIRHRRSDSTWTEWKRVAFTDQIIASVTNGLVISCDRVLSLPNLTSTLAGNAVDGSKNGAQRVLNLNCGSIQIKLSTGLAIDDGGYLYVQDKYVTK